MDQDGDGYTPNGGDCDDTNATMFPRAPRRCDAKDNDCDGRLDFSTDVDVDGDGVPLCALDCNDNNPNIYPGNIELYGSAKCTDGLDNDCNKKADALDLNCQNPCIDNDGDGYGNPGSPLCPNGGATDCNNSSPAEIGRAHV